MPGGEAAQLGLFRGRTSSMSLYILEKAVDDVTLLDLRGRIVLGTENVSLRERVNQLVEGGHTRIILNLEQVDYIDSVGLSSLVASFTAARKKGGDLKLLHLTKRVRDLLQITRLITVFETFENLDAAQKSFQRSGAA
jgi:anti-sigma B factor antagonist